LDSADVVWTFRRLLDPTVGSGAAASILDFLTPEGIQAVDDYTVSFTAAEPVAEMPLLLTNKFNLVVPDGSMHEDLQFNGVGTGPFINEGTMDPGSPVHTLVANENYWQGAPKAKCLEVSVISESLTAVSALKSGDIDLMLSLDPAVLGTVADDENIVLLETGAGTSMTISFDVTQAPFDDVKVRQALKAVVDRQAMLDTALLGVGELGNDNPVPPSWPSAYTSEIKQQDIELAKQLLADSGHPDGLDIDLYTSDALPGMTQMAQLYQQMAAEAGINVNLQVTPAESYWDDIWMQRPAFSSGWSIRPPAEGLSVAYSEESSWNETQWRDPAFQALLTNGKTEIDDAKRAQYLKDAQQMLSEQGGVIIPLFIHQVAGLRSNCSGYQPHAQNFNIDYHELMCE
jgi:peptide/nickel transport system substrate-binding protein